jgi:NAD-dependent SIR2 family protein deacetylase
MTSAAQAHALTENGREAQFERLVALVGSARRLLVLTGAGCSTASGIPDYRDDRGDWKGARPVLYQEFLRHAAVRRRYWARSMSGWRYFASARPNTSHRMLAKLEALGRVAHVVTQNVDGLHRAAGSLRVLELHGRLDSVLCLQCGLRLERTRVQAALERMNPSWTTRLATAAPDGDALLDCSDFDDFEPPCCERCGGLLKPDVVFFGECVPPPRVAAAMELVSRADAMLVVGSSLMVRSGYRFVLEAHARTVPIGAINLGATRGDALFVCKLSSPCGRALERLVERLEQGH